jgi:hypothetical protein
VAITLHSQLAGVAAGVAARDPALRVVFVMSGGGALPLVLSDLVAGLRDRGLLSATVTAGHCFGGDLEAVGIADGLCLAAARLDAHVIITGPGPGLVGTGSDLGTTALDAAGALDAAAALRAEPVLAVRASATDERLRHRGISHHTDTVAALVRSRVDIAVPPSLAGDAAVLAAPREAGVPAHRLVLVEDPGAIALLRAHQLDVATMGRDALTDELFLPAAAAAGAHAASLAAAQDHR